MRLTANPVEKEAAKEALLRDSYARALREARLRQNIRSQAALAKRSRVPEYVVGALERGEKPIDLEVIARICDGMGIDIEDFLEEVRQIQLRLLLPVKAKLRGGANQQENKQRVVQVDLRKALEVVGEAFKKVFLDIVEEQKRIQRTVPMPEEQLLKPGRKKRRSVPDSEG